VVGAITGKQTVPQVFINGRYVGGSEELEAWAKEGVSKDPASATKANKSLDRTPA